MKLAVVGLGAIGTHLAAHMASTPEISVSALVRQGETGSLPVSVRTPGGERRGVVRIGADAAGLGVQDVVFFTVKAQQLLEAAQRALPMIGPQTVVLPPSSTIPYWYFHGLAGFGAHAPQTLDPGGELARLLPPHAVLGCAFWVGATQLGRGAAAQEGAVAAYPIGELDGTPSERARRLADAMERAGLRAPLRPDIRSEIWMKLINSLCWNTIAVLTCAEMSLIGTEDRVVSLARRMMDEAERVARHFGAVITVPVEKRIATALAATGHRMSSLQDLVAGRPLELDDILESFQRMQLLSGIPTPLIDDMAGLATLRSRSFFLEKTQ